MPSFSDGLGSGSEGNPGPLSFVEGNINQKQYLKALNDVLLQLKQRMEANGERFYIYRITIRPVLLFCCET